MPRIRQISQQVAPQTQAQTPAAQPGAFGGGEGLMQAGQQIGQFAERVAQVQQRKQNRVDSVERAKIRTEYLSFLNDEAMRVQNEEDITKPSTLAAFGSRARDKMNELISMHEGSEDSKARLMVNLEESFSQQSRTLSSFAVAEGKKLTSQALTNEFSRIGAQAAATGEIEDALALVDAELNEYAGSFSKAEEAAERQRGRGIVYTEAYLAAMEENNMEGAKALLANEDFRVTVGDEAYRRYRLDFLSARQKENEAMQSYQNNLEIARNITGEEPGKESDRTKIIAASGNFIEFLPKEDDLNAWVATYRKLFGFDPPRADIERRMNLRGVERTPEEEIAATNAALAQRGLPPMTPEETRSFLVRSANNQARSTESERRTSFLIENAEAFGNGGILSQEEETLFIEYAVLERRARTRTVTTDQGVVTSVLPFSPVVQSALDARGVDLETVNQLITPEGQGYQEPDIQPLPEGRTVYGTVKDAIGPKQSFLAALSNVYFLGPLLTGAEGRRASAARQRIRLNNRNLISALINNSRGAVWEQQRLEADLGLEPGVFEDPEGYLVKIVGINDILEQRKKQLIDIAATARTKTDQDWASKSLAIINSYQNTVGLPAIVREPSDIYAQNLQVGDAFFDPIAMEEGTVTQEWLSQNPDPREQ